MTYLDTLVRILPRQRRAFEHERSRGYGEAIFGFLVGFISAIVLSTDPGRGWLTFWAAMATLGGWLLLLGGLRLTQAEIRITENEHIAKALTEASAAQHLERVVADRDEIVRAAKRIQHSGEERRR